MSLEFSLVTGDELDVEQFAEMQALAFAEVNQQNQTEETRTPDLYRWKYNGPHQPAYIALVTDGGRHVAANAMVRTDVRDSTNGQTRAAWQSCDTATLPEARGQGCFQRCLDVLREALQPEDVFFGFPNANSVRGFQKIGWDEQGVMDLFVRPAHTCFASKRATQIDLPPDRAVARGDASVHLDLSPAYLMWRYHDRPDAEYAYFAADDGFAVCRLAEVMGWPTVMVMELEAGSAATGRALLGSAGAWGRGQGAVLVAVMDNRLAWQEGLQLMHARVPRRFVPKHQVLMGEVIGASAGAFSALPWRVKLGDWDVF